MKHLFLVITFFISFSIYSIGQSDTTAKMSKVSKTINDVGGYGKKVIVKIKEFLAMSHKVPKGYVDMSPIQFVSNDSISIVGLNSKITPELSLKLLYPRITPSKGYFSFQLGDYTYFKYIKNLNINDIEYIKLISENGLECFVDKYEFVKKNSQKRHFVFLLDHSGSMGDKRASMLQQALYNAIEQNNKIDKLSSYYIYKFSYFNRKIAEGNNPQSIKSYLIPTSGLDGFGGGTAVKDALISGIEELRQVNIDESKLLVLFTDGDSNSDLQQTPMSEVLKSAIENNINIVSVAFGSYLNVAYLQDIAKYSGGNLYHIYRPEEFNILFDNIFQDVRTSYDLSFVPCNFGNEITLEMKLKSGDKHFIGSTIFRTPIKPGYTIDLNILFDNNSFQIRPTYYERLANLLNILNSNPSMEILIEGHTDRLGDEKKNQILSEKRAIAVKEYLVKKGINGSRIKTNGYGSLKPAFEYTDGSTINPKNRRIQVVISKE